MKEKSPRQETASDSIEITPASAAEVNELWEQARKELHDTKDARTARVDAARQEVADAFEAQQEVAVPADNYDTAAKEAGWDSPQRAKNLVESFITPGATVLDIGIGTGQAVEGYAERGATVIGLDHDQSMLEKAKTVIGESGSLRQADINKELPISDLKESIDVAQAVGVLEFAEDLPNVLKQVYVGLKDNGVFVFTVEIAEEGSDTETHYPGSEIVVYRHSSGEIKTLLEQSGFNLQFTEQYGGYERDGAGVPYGIFLAQKQS